MGHGFLQRRRMDRAAAVIDVATVGVAEQLGDLRAQPSKQRCRVGCARAVRTVDNEAEPRQAASRDCLAQRRLVGRQRTRRLAGWSRARRLSGQLRSARHLGDRRAIAMRQPQIFETLHHGRLGDIVQLRAAWREQLDAVVVPRVVGGRDHRPCRSLELGCERHDRCGYDSEIGDVGTSCAQARGQRPSEGRTRLAGVAANDPSGSARAA